MRSSAKGSEMQLATAARMRRALTVPVLALAASAASALFAAPAYADFRVCNATQSLVGVSIGYRAQAGWITEGWWHIEGSTCKTLIEGPLASWTEAISAPTAS